MQMQQAKVALKAGNEAGGRGARMTSAVGPEQAKLEAKALDACDQRMSSEIIALRDKLTTSGP